MSEIIIKALIMSSEREAVNLLVAFIRIPKKVIKLQARLFWSTKICSQP
ncbi:6629_t:CDS:2 [Funneliformis geosporum]|uniref:6629_t:CDS:1 n=1 Tax=Funneliformis geosporum TaxID=1117311 RepID=A0A9W4WNC0_9GLOM|nr:6629_t:CDS:2 [Funneliformis geosporum]